MRRQSWERQESYTWPSDKPVWTYTAFAVSTAVVVLGMCIELSRWTPLQQYWLPTYLSANFMPKLGVTGSKYRLSGKGLNKYAGQQVEIAAVVLTGSQLAGAQVPLAFAVEHAPGSAVHDIGRRTLVGPHVAYSQPGPARQGPMGHAVLAHLLPACSPAQCWQGRSPPA